MEKVATTNYYALAATPSSALDVQSTRAPLHERNAGGVRGHHSSVGKAIEAHRGMVEERQNRNLRRSMGVDMMSAQQPHDMVVADDVTDDPQALAGADPYESTLIEPAASQAKAATIQSFQSQEPDRPIIGEPVPKGSYLDVEA